MINNQSRGGGSSGKLTAIGILLCAGVVAPLQAAEFDYGLGYLGTHSDNITRVPTNERSDSINSFLAGFAYQENTVDLVAHVLAQAEYDTYQKNSYGDQNLYYVDSSAVWMISPQRFLWTLQDTARQALLNSTVADTPANRTNVNVLSTGPDVQLRFSPVQSLSLGARVGDLYTGAADADSKRFDGTASWLYQASSVTTYSLNYQALDVKYNNATLNDSFTRQDIFVRDEYRPSRSLFTLDLGTSAISLDRGGDFRGSLARLSWTRQLTPISTFRVTASREYSDTGTDLLSLSQGPLTPTVGTAENAPSTILTSETLTSDVYVAKRGEIFYNYRGSQFGMQFEASQNNFDFATTPQDRKETDGGLVLNYFYSPAITASMFTDYAKAKYVELFLRNTDRDSGIRFGYRVTRTITLGLEGRHSDRVSTDPTQNYVENRVLVSVLYSSGPLFTPVSGR